MRSKFLCCSNQNFVELWSAYDSLWDFPGDPVVKNLTAMQEIQVWSLGQEDPREQEMATHSSILAWRSPWSEEPGGLHPVGLQNVLCQQSSSQLYFQRANFF